jgi:hypothetical protein
MTRKDFREKDKIKVLLWCARHCCLCGKARDVDIEVAHIPREEEKNEIENAIPLCFNCHAKVGHYNPKHPKGIKFTAKELRKRRDQIYEHYTRHLVPPILPRIQYTPNFGNASVGFCMEDNGGYPPARARVKLNVYLGWRSLGLVKDEHGYYSGETDWHLNPMNAINGNFTIPQKCVESAQPLRIQVNVTVIDAYERQHELLPWSYQYDRKKKNWFLEPTSFQNLRSRTKRQKPPSSYQRG